MAVTEQTKAPESRDTVSLDPSNSIQTPAIMSDIYRGNRCNYRVDGAFGGSFAGAARDLSIQPLPWYRRKSYYAEGWTDAVVWRSAVVESIATACMVYLSGQFGVTLMSYGTIQIAAYVGIFSAILLSLFIYATASTTGGHLNPAITVTTCLMGLTPISRGTILISAQTLGGALAGGMLRGSLGYDRAVSHMGGGNFFDPKVISPGQVLLTEAMSTLAILLLAVGNGLDPRQQALYGYRMGPMLVGLSLGIVVAAGSGLAPGYTGPGLNPARALGLAIAGNNWQNHWVWWVGPIVGGIVSSSMYNFAPPSLAERVGTKAQTSNA